MKPLAELWGGPFNGEQRPVSRGAAYIYVIIPDVVSTEDICPVAVNPSVALYEYAGRFSDYPGIAVYKFVRVVGG